MPPSASRDAAVSDGQVVAVSRSPRQHRSRKRWRPDLPNLRQVHLLHVELLEDLRAQGCEVQPGQIGESVLTRGVDLLALPTGARLWLGAEAVVEATLPDGELVPLKPV